VDLHTEQARRLGETQQRLDTLPVWHESPYFDERERAALNWAESLTLVSQTRAPDSDYDQLCEYFSEEEIVDLSIAIALMNAWNRISVGFRKMPD
jgi:alkylhydroperoxidase family enzyme